MNTRRTIVPIIPMLTIMALLAIGVASAPPSEATAPPAFADPLFQQQWEYSDKPILEGRATRSWIWGGTPGDITQVEYEGELARQGVSAGKLLVQYFDKARMEYVVSNSSPPAMTNGRLVVEMLTGLIEVGRSKYLPAIPSGKSISGDTQGGRRHKNTPTYATLYSVASKAFGGLAPYMPAKMPVGTAFTNTLDRFGTVGVGLAPKSVLTKARAATYKEHQCYDPNKGQITCGQNIPDMFMNFLNQSGQVFKDGKYQQSKVFEDWVNAVGLPITDPYWTQINIDGKEHWVLFQAFERRILTYNPDNLPPWDVEMGNVGLHYKDWRNTRPDPNGVLVIQAAAGSTTEVCSKYLASNYHQCDGQSYEPEPSITTLQPGSWASTKAAGGMILESTSTIFHLSKLAGISFKLVSDDITEATQGNGRVDYLHDPAKGTLIVEANKWRAESVHSLFSIILTDTGSMEQPSLFVVVPSNGGGIRVYVKEEYITVSAGSQLTIEGGNLAKLEPISPEEATYWANLLDRLRGIPSLRVVLQNSISGSIPTSTPTSTPTYTFAPTPIPPFVPTSTSTFIPTSVPTSTPPSTSTPTSTSTSTSTFTLTPTPPSTPTSTFTLTSTPTFTTTVTLTPTSTPTPVFSSGGDQSGCRNIYKIDGCSRFLEVWDKPGNEQNNLSSPPKW